MANSNIEIYKICFCFSVEIEQINGYASSKVSLPDNSWTIKITKRVIGGEEVVDLHLTCSMKCQIGWTCEANATVTLHSNKFGQEPRKKELSRVEFSNRHLCETLWDFIKCAELEEYVQNGLVVFDVELHVNPVLYVFGPTENIRSVSRFTVKDIFNPLEHNWNKCSPDIIVRGTTFYVNVYKGNEKLQVSLYNKMDSRNLNWTWNIKCSLALLSFDPSFPAIRKTFNKSFDSRISNCGFNNFLAWADFIDPSNKYVQNNQAIFEIDLEADPPKSILCLNQRPSNSSGSGFQCSICLHAVIGHEPTTTNCGHLFCNECIKLSIARRPKCPVCNGDVTDLRRIFI